MDTRNGTTKFSGAAWADVNRDGLLDLFLPQYGGPSRLWVARGRPDRFRLEAAGRGIADAGFATGAVFADDDNDDDQDLYVVRHGPNSLYENDARGHFRDVAGLPRTRGRVAVQDARLIRRRPADRILILRERRRGAR